MGHLNVGKLHVKCAVYVIIQIWHVYVHTKTPSEEKKGTTVTFVSKTENMWPLIFYNTKTVLILEVWGQVIHLQLLWSCGSLTCKCQREDTIDIMVEMLLFSLINVAEKKMKFMLLLGRESKVRAIWTGAVSEAGRRDRDSCSCRKWGQGMACQGYHG